MKWFMLIGGMGIVIGFAGCDFGHAYEARLNESRETLAHSELLSGHLQENAWDKNDLGLTLRIPKRMQRLRESQVDADGKVTPSPDLDVEPTLNLSLPNRIATFRTYVEVGVGANRRRLPVYLYLAAANSSADQAESGRVPAGAFREQVESGFLQAFPNATEPETHSFPSTPVFGVTKKVYAVSTAQTSGEFISLRGGRDRKVSETCEATVELFFLEDKNLNQAALLFYWPQGTIKDERPDAIVRLRRGLDLCLETMQFASR